MTGDIDNTSQTPGPNRSAPTRRTGAPSFFTLSIKQLFVEPKGGQWTWT